MTASIRPLRLTFADSEAAEGAVGRLGISWEGNCLICLRRVGTFARAEVAKTTSSTGTTKCL